jgi:hypothetical protein
VTRGPRAPIMSGPSTGSSKYSPFHESDGITGTVVFERLTGRQRHSLIRQLEANGISLRPFDDSDKRRARVRDAALPGKLRTIAALLLASPYLLIMRARGRTTEMYAARRAEMT